MFCQSLILWQRMTISAGCAPPCGFDNTPPHYLPQNSLIGKNTSAHQRHRKTAATITADFSATARQSGYARLTAILKSWDATKGVAPISPSFCCSKIMRAAAVERSSAATILLLHDFAQLLTASGGSLLAAGQGSAARSAYSPPLAAGRRGNKTRQNRIVCHW